MWKRFVAVLCVCFLLLPSCLALADENPTEWIRSLPTPNARTKEYSSATPSNLDPDQILADSFILMEASSQQVLMERDPDKLQFPASTTKVLTALLALSYGNLDDVILVSENAVNQPEGASIMGLKVGEEITLKDALYGMLLVSGGDAAVAIAEHIGGDVEGFVALMNETAKLLGCENTHFTNPDGRHDVEHVTTARDLAVIMHAAMQNETFCEIIKTVEYTRPATNTSPRMPSLGTLNSHLRKQTSSGNDNYYYNPNSLGGKTGTTSQAGYVLVEAAEKDGVKLIAVVMFTGRYERWDDTTRLFNYGFSQYKSITPEEIYEKNKLSLHIAGFDPEKERDSLGELELALQTNENTKSIRYVGLKDDIDRLMVSTNEFTNVRWLTEPRAPVSIGQVMGTISFFNDEGQEAKYDLVATRSIDMRKDAPPTLLQIEERVLADTAIFPPFDLDWTVPPLAILLAIALLLRALFRRFLRRHGKRRQIPKPKRRYFS